MKLIAKNSAAAQELEEELAKTPFQNTDTFIASYNSGLFNRKNDLVRKIATKITGTYINVKETAGSKELVYISEDEIYIERIAGIVASWEPIIKLREAIKPCIADGVVTENDTIFVSEDSTGYVFIRSENGLTKLTTERLYTREDVSVLRMIADKEQREGDFVAVPIINLLSLDTSFVKDLYEKLPRVAI